MPNPKAKAKGRAVRGPCVRTEVEQTVSAQTPGFSSASTSSEWEELPSKKPQPATESGQAIESRTATEPAPVQRPSEDIFQVCSMCHEACELLVRCNGCRAWVHYACPIMRTASQDATECPHCHSAASSEALLNAHLTSKQRAVLYGKFKTGKCRLDVPPSVMSSLLSKRPQEAATQTDPQPGPSAKRTHLETATTQTEPPPPPLSPTAEKKAKMRRLLEAAMTAVPTLATPDRVHLLRRGLADIILASNQREEAEAERRSMVRTHAKDAPIVAPLPGTSPSMYRSQLAAPPLPLFNGSPAQFNTFFQCYQDSTRAFGCTDATNRGRLEQALYGKARAFVDELLAAGAPPKFIVRRLYSHYLLHAVRAASIEPRESEEVVLRRSGQYVRELIRRAKRHDAPEVIRDHALTRSLACTLPLNHCCTWFLQPVGNGADTRDLIDLDYFVQRCILMALAARAKRPARGPGLALPARPTQPPNPRRH